MCDFASVRNWLIAANVALGGAISSVILGLAWPLIRKAGFWGGFAWSGTALTFSIIASFALTAFCKCAANIAACTLPCSIMNSLMNVFMATMFSCAIFSLYCATHDWADWMAAAFLAAGALAGGLAAALDIWAVSLGACQPPPTSSGTGGRGPRDTDTDDRPGPVGSSPR
jgi:hypothetical protein